MAHRLPATIERDHRAASLYNEGLNFREIGDVLGFTRQAARYAVIRAIKDIPKGDTEEVLKRHLANLDYLEQEAFDILERKHVAFSVKGDIVVDAEDNEIVDDDVALRAIHTILKVQDQRAKLLGLNAPTRTELTGARGGPILITDAQATLEAYLAGFKDAQPALKA